MVERDKIKRAAYDREYRRINLVRLLSQKSEYRRTHPEEIKAWFEKNHEVLKAKRLQKYQRNRDAILARAREYNRLYPERMRAARRRFRLKDLVRTKLLDERCNLKRNYGISLEQFLKLEKSQSGVCAICGGPPVTRKRLSVDHSHVTGKIRGLLCINCNSALGLFKESSANLQKALMYLERTE